MNNFKLSHYLLAAIMAVKRLGNYTSAMQTATLTPDIVIIGGGIAGLWTLSQLRAQGYSALLFEQGALGSGQTINSQGIIHGGLKYALAGRPGSNALALARQPALWRNALAGKGPVNIKGVPVVSDHIHMWSSGTPSARLATFLGSKALVGQVDKLSPKDYPALFQSPKFRGALYRIQEQVLDIPSLLGTLAQHNRDHILTIDWQQAALAVEQGLALLRLPGVDLQPRLLLLAAGAGNAQLLKRLGADAPAMQRRPVQQVLLKQPGDTPLFGHFIGSGLEPGLSVTSHPTPNGDTIWYVGGALATDGAQEDPLMLIQRAQQELSIALPGWECHDAQWHTLKVDRAEVAQNDGSKPDDSFFGGVPGIENAMVSWPTKLVLAPQLADKVSRHLAGRSANALDISALSNLGRPEVAQPAWETLYS
jgi:glycine/D-amino acid oxidase-like deaminating enzyme